MTGWIALRYLNDPATARKLFAHIDDGATNPIVLARANYWRARAAEASGDAGAARGTMKPPRAITLPITASWRASNSALKRSSCARRRQLTRLRRRKKSSAPPTCSTGRRARRVVVSFAADLAEDNAGDVATLSAFGELTFRRNDAHAMLENGKTALSRSLPADHYAFSDCRHPGAQTGRSRDRDAASSIQWHAPKARVRPARQIVGQYGWPDAGHARSRARHRQAVRRHL